MISSISVRLLDSGDDPLLDDAEQLFLHMYDYMSEHGLLLPLVDNGEKRWRESVEVTLGKLGVLAVALQGEQLVGFAQGIVKLTPNYLGTRKVGSVLHVFVADQFRGKRVGEMLYHKLEDWFVIKGVDSVDLQVLCNNALGKAFWRKMGFDEELIQMRKTPAKTQV